MIVIAFGDVKPHEVGSVMQIVQALRSRAFPLEPAQVVEPATPKLLPAPAEGVEKCGARNAECGVSNAKIAKDTKECEGEASSQQSEVSSGGKCGVQSAECVDGREIIRPVNVNVVVNTANVNAEKTGSGLPNDNAETVGNLDTIRKHTDLLPGILDKVEATPQRTAGLLGGHGRRKFHTFGNVVEEGFSASAHFTNLCWGDKRYVIRRCAAVIVEALYIVLRVYDLPGLGQNEVFAQVYGADKKKWPSGNARIQNFFRRGDAKRLWDDGLIGHDGKGNFHLNLKERTGAADRVFDRMDRA